MTMGLGPLSLMRARGGDVPMICISITALNLHYGSRSGVLAFQASSNGFTGSERAKCTVYVYIINICVVASRTLASAKHPVSVKLNTAHAFTATALTAYVHYSLKICLEVKYSFI